MKIRFWGARGGMCALQPLKNHRNYCPFCVPAPQGRKLVKCKEIIRIYGFPRFFGNSMIFNEIQDILCFQPSATLHETFIFLRKKQGLKSLALQGARKTEILVKFQKVHEIS